MKPLVSIVILNWNSEPFVHDCIKSVLAQTYPNIEVIFVDNKSSDDSLLNCKSKYPSFTYVENKNNLGFAAGMNSGLPYVKGKYCLLLNTDVFLDSNYVTECVSLMENDRSVCCTAGYEYKWRYPNFTGTKVGHGTYGIALHLRVIDCLPRMNYDFGVSGSFPVFRMETINEIINMRGFFFDEMFGTGWEDTELRFLFLLLGKNTKLCTNTKAWHIGSAADNGNTGMFEKNLNYQTRIFRNRFYIIEKYIKGNFILWPLYVSIINCFLYLYIYVKHKESLGALSEAKKEFKENKIEVKRQRLQINNIISKKHKYKLLKHIVSI